MSKDRFESGAWASHVADTSPQDGERYERRGLLGVGGMGEVLLCWDPILEREVALKVPRKADGDAWVAEEARTTAQLEHPGVVPVYDAGETDGRPWFAMRVVRGETLREALDGGLDRVRLLRHVLAVCHVTAYAHDRGLVHRDLKPSNVMVGAYGETQVLDWGLAQPSSSSGGAHGTPAYMAPEAARGEPVDARADVWSLGTLVAEVWSGEPPPPKVATLPPELRAIVARARAKAPGDRYPDAGALAADLGAWLDGGRVAAHTYTAWELAVRAVRAWRVPLAVTAVAGLVGVVGVAVAVDRIVTERDRAVLAEQRATAQSARLLTERAVRASADGDRPAAEILAAHALARAPSPAARGVLAAWGVQQRPERVAAVDTPVCAAGGIIAPTVWICDDGPDAVGLDPATGAERWRLRRPGSGWSVPADGGSLLLLSPGTLEVVDPASGVVRRTTAGPSGSLGVRAVSDDGAWLATAAGGVFATASGSQVAAAACAEGRAIGFTPGGRLVSACADGSVVVGRPGDDAATFVTPWDAEAGAAFHVVAPDDRHALLAVGAGVVVELDLDTGDHRTVLVADRRIETLRADDRHLLVVDREGHATAHRRSDGVAVAVLPLDGSRAPALVDGRVVALGPFSETWALPAQPRPPVVGRGTGVGHARHSRDGAWIATAHADGTVRVVDATTGASPATLRWQDRVAKWVSFSPDGRYLLASAAGAPGVRRFAVDGWRDLGTVDERAAPRVSHVGDAVVVVSYSSTAFGLDPDGARIPALDVGTGLNDTHEAADAVWLLTEDGRVLRATAAPYALTPVAQLDGSARRITAHGDRWAWADGTHATVVEDGADGATFTANRTIADIAVSDALLAVGTVDGAVHLVDRDGVVVAQLPGHSDVAASVAFDPSGPRLLTGSWDGTARQWDLSGLDQDGAVLVAEVEAAWGRTLDDVLAR